MELEESATNSDSLDIIKSPPIATIASFCNTRLELTLRMTSPWTWTFADSTTERVEDEERERE